MRLNDDVYYFVTSTFAFGWAQQIHRQTAARLEGGVWKLSFSISAGKLLSLAVSHSTLSIAVKLSD